MSGRFLRKNEKTTRFPHWVLTFTRLHWGKGGSFSHTARGSPSLHIPDRARVHFSGRERASPRFTAGLREFVLLGCARVFTGQPGGERVTRLTPGFLAVPAAVQQATLHLCGEVRVVCDLRSWRVSVRRVHTLHRCVYCAARWLSFFFGGRLPSKKKKDCLLYTSPSPRDRTRSRMPSSA